MSYGLTKLPVPSLSCPWFIAVAHPQGVWRLGGGNRLLLHLSHPKLSLGSFGRIPRLYLFSFSLSNNLLTHLVSIWTPGEREDCSRWVRETGGSHSPHIGKPIDPHWGSVVEEACGTCPHLCSLQRPEGHSGMGRAADQRTSLKTGGVRPFQWTFLITGGAERSRDLVIWKLLPREKRAM